jgi:hypothetical protein
VIQLIDRNRPVVSSWLLNRGADIAPVKELLGHSTVTVTMRYANANMDKKRDAVHNLVSECDNSVTMAPRNHRCLKIVTRKI